MNVCYLKQIQQSVFWFHLKHRFGHLLSSFLDQSIRKTFYLILKTEALDWRAHRDAHASKFSLHLPGDANKQE